MKLPIRRYWALLVKYLRPQRGRALLLALLLLTNIGLSLLNPQIMRFFIDTTLDGGALQTLIQAALLFLVIAIAGQALNIGTNYLSEQVGWSATNALRFDLMVHCLGLDLSFHKAHTPDGLIERIDGDVQKLANFFTHFMIQILGNALLMIGVLIVLWLEDWRVGAGLSGFALLALALMIRIRTLAIPYWLQVRQIEANFYGFLVEQLTSTEDIQTSGAQAYVLQRFYALLRGWLPVLMRANLAGYAMRMTTIAIFAIGTIVAFGLGALLYYQGAISIGTVFLIVHYTDLLRIPLMQIRNQLTDLQEAEASIGRIEALLQTQSKLPAGQGTALPAGPLAVAFQDVSFSYEGEEQVLQAISFHLTPGRVLGLLGRTGSGKSTLARLLLRLYDPTAVETRRPALTCWSSTISPAHWMLRPNNCSGRACLPARIDPPVWLSRTGARPCAAPIRLSCSKTGGSRTLGTWMNCCYVAPRCNSCGKVR